MAKKAASKTLRPTGATAIADDPKVKASIDESNRELGVARPESAGGDVNFDGSDITAVGRDFVDISLELDRLEELVTNQKRKLKAREDWLIENMRLQGCESMRVAGTSGTKKTLFTTRDWIVSKGKGVTTEQLAGVLREVGIPELIDVAVNANTLKATVKQQMATAGLAGDAGKGERGYCRHCSTFHSVEAVGSPCPNCDPSTGDGDSIEVHEIIRTIDGIPSALRSILYLEEKYKLGVRSA